MAFGSPTPIFPGRLTVLSIDGSAPLSDQPTFLFERIAKDVNTLGGEAKRSLVRHHPGIGWRLAQLQFPVSSVHERTDAGSQIQSHSGGLLQVAAKHVESDVFSQKPFIGVTYPASSVTGDPFIKKAVPAGTTFEAKITADQDAFPGPATDEDTVAMDRVALTTNNHEPDEDIIIRLYVPDHDYSQAGQICNFYFSALAGGTDGTGQMCAKLGGDGLANLYEKRSNGEWAKRYSWQWAEPQNVRNAIHAIHIVSDAVISNGAWRGTRLLLYSNTLGNSWGLISTLAKLSAEAITLQNSEMIPSFRIDRRNNLAPTLGPARVDIRRDIRASFQISKVSYWTDGHVDDDVFSLDFLPYGDDVLATLRWYGDVPEGTTLDVHLFRADDNTEVASTVVYMNENGGARQMVLPDGVDQYWVKIVLGSTLEDVTPTFRSFELERDLVEKEAVEWTAIATHDGDLLGVAIDDVSIQGASVDANDEAMSITVTDLLGNSLESLQYRASFPIRLSTHYQGDGGEPSILFQGYAQNVIQEIVLPEDAVGLGGNPRQYPKPGAKRYRITCVGQWLLIQEAFAPDRYIWFDKETNRPSKVTDCVRKLFGVAGAPPSMLDIPDLSTRLFETDSDSENYQLENGNPIAPAIDEWTKGYFGGINVFDANAGDHGMYRMLIPRPAPYNVLARFDPRHPGDGKLAHVSGGYPGATNGSQIVLETFILKGTLRKRILPPEGNKVSVYGASGYSGNGGELLRKTLVNSDSYNFAGLSEGHPNYPTPGPNNLDYLNRVVPIRGFDATLSNQYAVDWFARRIYDVACHGIEELTFTAPLLLVGDSQDINQVRPRKLQVYDAVEVWSDALGDYQTYIVRQCNPRYSKDGFQFAEYVLNRSKLIDVNGDGYGQLPSLNYLTTHRFLTRPMQLKLGDTFETKRHTRGAGAAAQSKARWSAMPETSRESAQITDPDAPEFGQAIFTWGFDMVGSATKPIGGAAA